MGAFPKAVPEREGGKRSLTEGLAFFLVEKMLSKAKRNSVPTHYNKCKVKMIQNLYYTLQFISKNAMKLHFTKSLDQTFSKVCRVWDRVPRYSINLYFIKSFTRFFSKNRRGWDRVPRSLLYTVIYLCYCKTIFNN